MSVSLIAALSLLLASCTTLGLATRQPDWNPPIGVQVCVTGHPEPQALLDAAWPGLYGIHLVALCPGLWDVEVRPRSVVAAITWSVISLVAFEVLGAASPNTGEAWIKAGVPSWLSLVWPPHRVLRHELHHLIGCKHALTMRACYEVIQAFKRHRGAPRWQVPPSGLSVLIHPVTFLETAKSPQAQHSE